MFEWARPYPDLYKLCERFSLYELENVQQVRYTELEGVLQEGPQCGLAALAICMQTPNSDAIKQLYLEAKDCGYTYNGELFSAEEFSYLVQKRLNNKVTLYNGCLDCKEIEEFLLADGLILVPYDCDKNHAPCNNNGNKAHWAIILGILIALNDTYVIAKHGKSRNTAIWKLKDLADSNGQLSEFSEERKLSGKQYKLPEGGVGGNKGLKYKSICVWPNLEK